MSQNKQQQIGLTAADQTSAQLYERARKVFPDGVTRATITRDPCPVYATGGSGCYLHDADHRRYLDLANNFTTLIHGHAFPPVVAAVQKQIANGSCFANPTPSEIVLAELICDRIPAVEQLRFVNTGTEAVMFALKAARAYTGRTKIAKIEGAYHGGYDWAEVSENSSPENWGTVAPIAVPFYHGTPQHILDDMVILPYNDVETTRNILNANGDELAAIMIDTMPSRVGLVPMQSDYADCLAECADQSGAVLISDEVLNLRLSYHGAASRFGLEPDLVTMGKIIGGGLPIGAIGGSAEVMGVFSSVDGAIRVPQSGTFTANPLSMSAGIAAIQALSPESFDRLEALSYMAQRQLSEIIEEFHLPMSITGLGSMFRIHPKASAPRNYREAYCSPREQQLRKQLERSLHAAGIMPAAGTMCVLSTPMEKDDLALLVAAFRDFARNWKDAP